MRLFYTDADGVKHYRRADITMHELHICLDEPEPTQGTELYWVGFFLGQLSRETIALSAEERGALAIEVVTTDAYYELRKPLYEHIYEPAVPKTSASPVEPSSAPPDATSQAST